MYPPHSHDLVILIESYWILLIVRQNILQHIDVTLALPLLSIWRFHLSSCRCQNGKVRSIRSRCANEYVRNLCMVSCWNWPSAGVSLFEAYFVPLESNHRECSLVNAELNYYEILVFSRVSARSASFLNDVKPPLRHYGVSVRRHACLCVATRLSL